MKKIVNLIVFFVFSANAQVIGSFEHQVVIEHFKKNPQILSALANQYDVEDFGKCLAVNSQFNIAIAKGYINADQDLKYSLAAEFEGLAAARRKLLNNNYRQEQLDYSNKKYMSQIDVNSGGKRFGQMTGECVAIRNRVLAKN